jgi:hypothetical protein
LSSESSPFIPSAFERKYIDNKGKDLLKKKCQKPQKRHYSICLFKKDITIFVGKCIKFYSAGGCVAVTIDIIK